MNERTLTVSELNKIIKTLIDTEPLLNNVSIRGELSNYKVYPSGHHYFSLKDADGTLRCVMFRTSASKLRFRPENGMKVVATGGLGRIIAGETDMIDVYDPDLTLKGLRIIYEKQAKRKDNA